MPLRTANSSILGWWKSGGGAPSTDPEEFRRAIERFDQPFYVVEKDGRDAVGHGGVGTFTANGAGATPGGAQRENGAYPIRAYSPVCRPESLGDPEFCDAHGLRYPYIAGAMANGVGSVEIVEAMAREGMIGFFGAAGLSLERIEAAIDRVQADLKMPDGGSLPYGFNLIHSPSEPKAEAATVDLYLRRDIRLVSASAYLNLTLPLVRYRMHGIHRDASGEVVAPNRVIAKVSRVEVARRFFSPPTERFLRPLIESGEITAEQAAMAESIPVAQDLTAEADSGGHTDNRPFVTLLPTMLALRDELQSQYGYRERLRVGAAGGIGSPAAAAAAFAAGASYILTGSINQACVESGTSQRVRDMLRQTHQADVAMAPAADMFEMGVRVQVLKRGTMFAMRGAKLYELYRTCGSLDEIPAASRATLEKDFFRASLDEVWEQTRAYFAERDPRQVESAEKDPKYKMALVFRWYLGQSSTWAVAGDPSRQVDYQIWCGPAMGAFNQWVKGSALEAQGERRVTAVALNLMAGAAILTRIQNLRAQGIALPPEVSRVTPRALSELKERLNSGTR